jgi:hypothetical protein
VRGADYNRDTVFETEPAAERQSRSSAPFIRRRYEVFAMLANGLGCYFWFFGTWTIRVLFDVLPTRSVLVTLIV